jgi:hypothetical protein
MITQSQTAKPVRMAAVAMIAGVMAIAAACSSGSGASSSAGNVSRTSSPPPHTGSPTANTSACKHIDSVRTSLEDITHLQLNASAATKIRTDLSNIQAQLAMLKSEGVVGPPLSSSLNQLSASLKQVEKAAKGLSAPPSASEITAVVSALGALKTQSGATIAAMRTACPG